METKFGNIATDFSIMYHLQSLDGYDPIYLQRYGEFMIAIQRNKPDINPPFGFNRIITPTNVDSRIIDLFGVKYILSLSDLHDKKLTKVFTEGQTIVYKNNQAFPRAFFAETIKPVNNKNEAIRAMFDQQLNLHNVAIVEGWDKTPERYTDGKLKIIDYQANTVTITTQSNGNSFLVLTDTYYPTWRVLVDGVDQIIYRTDYNFRGVVLSPGTHTVIFYDGLF